MQHAVGQLVGGEIGGTEAENVGDGDRVMGGAHHIADHAADTGVGAAERLDGRRMVVRLGLDRDGGARHVREDACVAHERTSHERRIDGVRAVAQLLHEGRDLGAGRLAVERDDAGPKRLVRAVFAPCLGECLQLDVGGFAAHAAEVFDDGVELGDVQRQAALAVHRLQPLVVEIADRDMFDCLLGGRFAVDERRVQRCLGPALDHLIGQ